MLREAKVRICDTERREIVNAIRRKHMSFHPQPIPAIPEETARVAHTILPQGNVAMQMRDELGTLYQDEDFRDLFPTRGQPAQEPWRLALVTIMQYAEGLTDRQAADAVRTRIDWKYALSLELTSPGFDFSVLSEFRSRLVANGAERRLFDLLLAHFRERGWRKRAREATHRFHARAGSYSNHPSVGMCGRNAASRAECSWQKSHQAGCL
jgi:transposase